MQWARSFDIIISNRSIFASVNISKEEPVLPEYTMLILWIALLIAFIVVEAATVQLVTIWFAVGAAAALISELCSAPVWLPWVIFAAVSLVALAVTSRE